MRPLKLLTALLCAHAVAGCGAVNFLIRVDVKPEEIQYAATKDGWQIALYHYKAKGLIKRDTPVIMCHGMALNNLCWNLAPDVNFPGYLAARGFDVWTLDLRGNGRSKRLNRFGEFQSADVKEEGKRDPTFWCVDDYAKYDIPAVLDYVTEKTGKTQVSWVGHSMGGMIMYVFLETSPDTAKVKNFIAMGSPVVLPNPANDILRDMEGFQKAVDGAIDIGLKNLRATAGIAPVFSQVNALDTLYFNRSNIDWDNIKRLYARSLENIPRGVSRQMRELIDSGEFKSLDKKFNYARNLDKVTVPTLLIAAKGDALGSEYAVMTAFKGIASKDKTYRLFGVENKYDVNYGHCDMLFGEKAPREVYPFVAEWLEKRDK